MTCVSSEMNLQEKIIQERVNQSRKFLNSNGFHLLLNELSKKSRMIQNMIYYRNIKKEIDIIHLINVYGFRRFRLLIEINSPTSFPHTI